MRTSLMDDLNVWEREKTGSPPRGIRETAGAGACFFYVPHAAALSASGRLPISMHKCVSRKYASKIRRCEYAYFIL